MCKQIIVINPWQSLTSTVTNSLKAIVCSGGNADGFGIATTDETGVRYLKYVKPAGKVSKALKPIHKLNFVYGGEGSLPDTASKVLLAHGRYSTNDIGIAETHPILSKDHSIALVHNGVVRSSTVYQTITRNDSELILRAYETGGMPEVLKLGGYFAFGLIDYKKNRVYVVRDGQAMLYVSQVDNTDSFVFSTRQEDINLFFKTSAGKHKGKVLRHSQPVQVKDNTVIEFELTTGRMLDSYTFSKFIEPTTYSKYTGYSQASVYADMDADNDLNPKYDMANVLNYTQGSSVSVASKPKNKYWSK